MQLIHGDCKEIEDRLALGEKARVKLNTTEGMHIHLMLNGCKTGTIVGTTMTENGVGMIGVEIDSPFIFGHSLGGILKGDKVRGWWFLAEFLEEIK